MTTSLESATLKSLLSKENLKYIKYMSSLEDEYTKIIRSIERYYEKYQNHIYLSVDELETWFFTEYPQIKNRELYSQIFQNVRKLEISGSMANEVVKRLLARQTAEKICEHLMPTLGGEQPERLREIQEYLQDYITESEDVNGNVSPFIEDGITELLETEVRVDGLTWRLDCLNEAIGPLRKGTLGHIFARPESGKSSFVVSEVGHMLGQLKGDEVILGVFNEDKGRRMKLRLYESVLGCSEAELNQMSPVTVETRFNELGGGKFRLYYNPGATMEEIQGFLDTLPVRLLVVDIGDHVTFRDKPESKVEFLEALYRRFRVLAGNYNVDIITTGQADMACAGRKILHLENMNNSKVGKQGALDFAIGIGKTYDESEADLRWLTIVKNKLNSDSGGPYTVRIDKATGRYYDL